MGGRRGAGSGRRQEVKGGRRRWIRAVEVVGVPFPAELKRGGSMAAIEAGRATGRRPHGLGGAAGNRADPAGVEAKA